MRVLSVPQPFAQLIVRGAKHFEARSWTTDFRGRIAIHASSAVPPGSIMQQWDDDSIMARHCAEQGWVDREDLKALPRGAIVGTVEIVDMLRARDVRGEPQLQVFHEDPPLADRVLKSVFREDDLPEPVHSEFAMNGNVPNGHYLWKLADPVEIAPAERITGKLNLWKLSDEASAAVVAAEAQARRTAPVRVADEARRALSLERWKARCEARDGAVDRRYLDFVDAYEGRNPRVQFEDPATEQHVKHALDGYREKHRGREANNSGTVRLSVRLKPFFGGREWVAFSELEDTIRVVVKTESGHLESLPRDEGNADEEVGPADIADADGPAPTRAGGRALSAHAPAAEHTVHSDGDVRN